MSDILEQRLLNEYKDRQIMNNTPFHNVDHEEFPVAHYVTDQTDKWVTIHEYISGYSFNVANITKWLTKWEFKEVHTVDYTSMKKTTSKKIFSKLATNESGGVVVTLIKFTPFMDVGKSSVDEEEYNESGISLYSNFSKSGYDIIRTELFKLLKIKPKRENNISLIVQSRHGYDTQTFDLPKQQLNLEYNYGSSFLPIHNKILSTLNKKKANGLVLLHGEPGCGKTFYLKYLASKIKNKKVMFVPPYMVDFITSPEMTPFLIENSDSILFIEDAERVITDRDINSANGVSNILNLTDGILGDILNIQIVATFNMDRAKIDKALLRKGRLIAEHEFGKLDINESNKLIKHLGKDKITDKPLTLTQIYNIEEVEYKVGDKTSKIGF